MPQLTLPGHDFDIPQLCLPPLASRNYCDNYCLGFLLVHSAVDCVRKWQSKATTFTYTLVPCPCTLKAGQAGVAKWSWLLSLYKALGSISCRSLPLKKKNTIEPLFSSVPTALATLPNEKVWQKPLPNNKVLFLVFSHNFSWCFYPKGQSSDGYGKIAGITVEGTPDSQGNPGSPGTAPPRQLSHGVQCDWDLGLVQFSNLLSVSMF